MKKYDYIIVGTGAGGSTMAYKLAKSGKTVLRPSPASQVDGCSKSPNSRQLWRHEELQQRKP